MDSNPITVTDQLSLSLNFYLPLCSTDHILVSWVGHFWAELVPAAENPSFLSLKFLFDLNLNAVKCNKHAFLFQFYSQFATRELEHSCAWQADFILKPNFDQINKYPSKSGWIREDRALSAFQMVK